MKGRRCLGITEKADIKRLLQQFLDQREEIRFACLYGSFIEPSDFRDVDVAVWVDPVEVPEEKALGYAFTLSARLEHRISLPIDVQVLNYVSLGFQYAATQGEPVLVRDENEWCDYRERLWRDYWDFAPLAREALWDLLGQPTFPERAR